MHPASSVQVNLLAANQGVAVAHVKISVASYLHVAAPVKAVHN